MYQTGLKSLEPSKKKKKKKSIKPLAYICDCIAQSHGPNQKGI